jgi:hypothetical protein
LRALPLVRILGERYGGRALRRPHLDFFCNFLVPREGDDDGDSNSILGVGCTASSCLYGSPAWRAAETCQGRGDDNKALQQIAS